MMEKCPSCGKLNRKGKKRCSSCNFDLTGKETTFMPSEKEHIFADLGDIPQAILKLLHPDYLFDFHIVPMKFSKTENMIWIAMCDDDETAKRTIYEPLYNSVFKCEFKLIVVKATHAAIQKVLDGIMALEGGKA